MGKRKEKRQQREGACWRREREEKRKEEEDTKEKRKGGNERREESSKSGLRKRGPDLGIFQKGHKNKAQSQVSFHLRGSFSGMDPVHYLLYFVFGYR